MSVHLEPYIAELQERVEYCPTCGQFHWLNGVRVGKSIGSPTTDGHLMMVYRKKSFALHRLAWRFHYGEWPKQVVDHINRLPDDNRIENLRDISGAENARNRSPKKPWWDHSHG